MVHGRTDVAGLDASIIMHPKIWEASGHVTSFSDPLVECKNCHMPKVKDKKGKIIETPIQMFRRVAKAVSKAEKGKDKAAAKVQRRM